MKRNKSKASIDQCILFVLIGLFICPLFVREIIIPAAPQINYFALGGCLIIVYIIFKRGGLKRDEIVPYLMIVSLMALLIISEFNAGRTIKGFFRVFGGLIMPLPLLFYKMKKPENTIKVIVQIFNVVSIFIVVIGLLDFLIGKKIILSYYALANDSNYYGMAVRSSRLYSYVGHPLYNAEIFLITLGLNYIYSELFLEEHKSDKWIILFTMLGTAMTASKSAIVIYFGMLIVFYIKNWKYMILSMVMLGIGYYNNVFELVLQRFTGSLSSGRNQMWTRINESGEDFFHFLWGHGSDSKYAFSYLDTWAKAAFEYPYRLYALEFGILFCIIIMVFLFVVPVYRIIKNKGRWMTLCIVFGAVVLHVNIYNGIGTYSDHLYLYCLFGCTILNISNVLREDTANI